MILYICIITIAVALIAVVVAIVASQSYGGVLAYTALATIAVIFVDGVTAAICRALPASVANPEKKSYQVSAKEKKFYEKLKIRKWKDRIPEIGHFTGFRKNKLVDPKNVEYLDRFLLECSYGEIGHLVSCVSGFLILLCFRVYPLWFSVSIPVAIVNVLLNLPSFMVLRYNAYKLRILRESTVRKLRRQERAAEGETV